MLLTLYLLPLICILLLLMLTRMSVMMAGMIGLLLTLPGIWVALPETQNLPTFLLNESWRGAWIGWQAISVILAGLVFYQVVRTAKPSLFGPTEASEATFSYRQLFLTCFLLGPFAESATGFGVGMIVAVAALTRLGLTGVDAVVFGLFSQIFVTWGALAIGTVIGAALADMPLATMGLYCAVLTAPLLLGYLGVFWWLTKRLGHAPNLRQRLDDLAWIIALAALLYAANLVIEVEVAGLFATGALLLVRFSWDNKPSWQDLQNVAAKVAPYALLTIALLLTRTIPPLATFLRDIFVFQPATDLPVFPLFYHASFWLLLVAIAYGLVNGITRHWRQISNQVWVAGKSPVLVTLIFVIMAQWMAGAGIIATIAASWVDAVGQLAVLGSPLYGALAGILTASNTASNGIMMGLQATLADYAGTDPHWIAAVQNVSGSNFAMLSPIRIAMGCALLGLVGMEREIYRRAWPLGGVTLLVLIVACGLL